jgi:hypothetical protein
MNQHIVAITLKSGKTVKIVASVILLGIFLIEPLRAQTSQPSSYDFLKATIECLSQANDAITTIDNANGDLVSLTAALRNGSITFSTAALTIKPFSESPNEKTKAATEMMLTGLSYIKQAFDVHLDFYEKRDTRTTASDLTTKREGIRDATLLYQQGSKLLVDATTFAVASAIVPGPDAQQQNRGTLRLSLKETAALIDILLSRFGEQLPRMRAVTGPVMAAQTMINVLAQEWWFTE